jgi:hypothetical protein
MKREGGSLVADRSAWLPFIELTILDHSECAQSEP